MGVDVLAEAVDMDVNGLIKFIEDWQPKDKKAVPPLLEVNTDTLNALVARIGVEGARKYLAQRRRYLTGLQKGIQAEYEADKTNEEKRKDLEATYKELKEIAESVKALDATLKAQDAERVKIEQALKKVVPEKIADVSAEAEQIISAREDPALILEKARQRLESLMEREFAGIEEGERIYFAPGNAESFEQYLNHIIAGADPNAKVNPRRVQALWLVESTLSKPDLVTVNRDEGRRN